MVLSIFIGLLVQALGTRAGDNQTSSICRVVEHIPRSECTHRHRSRRTGSKGKIGRNGIHTSCVKPVVGVSLDHMYISYYVPYGSLGDIVGGGAFGIGLLCDWA